MNSRFASSGTCDLWQKASGKELEKKTVIEAGQGAMFVWRSCSTFGQNGVAAPQTAGTGLRQPGQFDVFWECPSPTCTFFRGSPAIHTQLKVTTCFCFQGRMFRFHVLKSALRGVLCWFRSLR